MKKFELMIKSIALVLAAFIGKVAFSAAPVTDPAPMNKIREMIQYNLTQRYPGAEIELIGAITVDGNGLPTQNQTIQYQGDTQAGHANFVVSGKFNHQPVQAKVSAQYKAWMQIYYPNQKIRPRQLIEKDQFVLNRIDMSLNKNRAYVGLYVDKRFKFKDIRTRQTILPGRPLLKSAIEKVPDVAKGEHIRLRLMSGQLTLVTRGVVQESAYEGAQVKVTVDQTKKILTGRLVQDKTVEVTL